MREKYVTPRLTLRLANEDMAGALLEYYIRNSEFFLSIDPIRPHEFYTEIFQRQELQEEMLAAQEGSAFRYYISENGSNAIIGMVGLNSIIMGAFRSCFMSYKLDRDKLRRGYMTEAVREVVRAAFFEGGLHRIEANIMPRNKASLRVVEKLGFVYEGLSRKYLLINGVWEDHIHMVILNPCDK